VTIDGGEGGDGEDGEDRDESSAAPHRLGEPPLVNWAMEVINQLPRGTH
jgi:hypothetical protein